MAYDATVPNPDGSGIVENDFESIRDNFAHLESVADITDELVNLENAIVNVKDFGAVGDGETDDTQAFQNAINYCETNNLSLFLPGETYYLTNLDIKCNIQGNLGAKIILDGGAQHTVMTNQNKINLLNITFEFPTHTEPFILEHSENIKLLNCNFIITTPEEEIEHDDSLQAVKITDINELIIDNCRAFGSLSILGDDGLKTGIITNNIIQMDHLGTWDGIKVSGDFSERIIIANNYIEKASNYGIDLFGSGQRIIISNNYIYQPQDQGIVPKVVLRDEGPTNTEERITREAIISNNHIIQVLGGLGGSGPQNSAAGIAAHRTDYRTTTSNEPELTQRDFIITNNYINEVGIEGEIEAGNACGIEFHGFNALITNNRIRNIYNPPEAGGDSGRGIIIRDETGIGNNLISNNIISCSSHGINIRNGSNLIISENIIDEDPITNITPDSGIYITGSPLYNTTIKNNLIKNTTGDYESINIRTSEIENLKIIDNTVLSGGIYVRGFKGLIIKGNIIDAGNGRIRIADEGISQRAIIDNNYVNNTDSKGIEIHQLNGGTICNNILDTDNRGVSIETGDSINLIIKNNIGYDLSVLVYFASAVDETTMIEKDNKEITT